MSAFKFFTNASTNETILAVTGASFQAACNSSGQFATGQTRILSTAENGIARVAQGNGGVVDSSDNDFDTGDSVFLLAGNFDGSGRADYMGAGGSPIVDAEYANEDGPGLDVGADCVIFGTSATV